MLGGGEGARQGETETRESVDVSVHVAAWPKLTSELRRGTRVAARSNENAQNAKNREDLARNLSKKLKAGCISGVS